MVRQDDLAPTYGARKKKKRIGRGLGSGHGRYSGKGLKGQKARSGAGIHPYFEGGQLPLVKRLPAKQGFTNIFKKEYCVVNVGRLNVFEANSVVDGQRLWGARLISSSKKPLKILGGGALDHALIVRAQKVSAAARGKIEAAGGRVEEAGSAAKAS
ncbi:MAG: 50S ribosomal protein L15 [Chloroflexi bacterium RBG_13_53_26]|nr:MAG: 50S ribosomal protein L15 [Chloroflexi bacterium RBG_13_53_26]